MAQCKCFDPLQEEPAPFNSRSLERIQLERVLHVVSSCFVHDSPRLVLPRCCFLFCNYGQSSPTSCVLLISVPSQTLVKYKISPWPVYLDVTEFAIEGKRRAYWLAVKNKTYVHKMKAVYDSYWTRVVFLVIFEKESVDVVKSWRRKSWMEGFLRCSLFQV